MERAGRSGALKERGFDMKVADSAAQVEKAPCIDHGQIDGLVAAAGVDGTLEILKAFWRSTDSLLAALREQLTASSTLDASRTAHALKGSALNVGATRLSLAIRGIEDCCRDSNFLEALSLLDAAERHYAETVAAFEAHLRKAD